VSTPLSLLAIFLQARRRRAPRTLASTLGHLGALGLFFLCILDSSPLPTFGGPDLLIAILAGRHKEPWWEYAAVATTGSVIGAWLTFQMARRAGTGYLTKKFRGGKIPALLNFFQTWGTSALAASTAIPIPFPTSLFFAAAGVTGYDSRRFVTVVALSRAARYSLIAVLADLYGRQFIRVIRHPDRYWGWLLLIAVIVAAMVIGAIIMNKRLENASPSYRMS
jgi:membrane protein YqaA with SNARE-associated domain